MSMMQELYTKVAGNSALQEKFNQILKDADNVGTSATEQKLLDFAQAEGYEISIEEMGAFFQSLSENRAGELSDMELDQVAGGKSTQGTQSIYISVVTLGTICALGSVIAAFMPGGCAGQFE